jgi:hypothetical protein
MKSEKTDLFWPSYNDLMTSLFFIMLVLFVLAFAKQSIRINDLNRQLAIVNAVDENLKPLKSDTTLFTYEEEYKRFKLSFDVKFNTDKFRISPGDLDNYQETINNINRAGDKLKLIINGLKNSKEMNSKLKTIQFDSSLNLLPCQSFRVVLLRIATHHYPQAVPGCVLPQ